MRTRRGERRYVFQAWWKRLATGILDAAGAAVVWGVTRGRGLQPDARIMHSPRRVLVARLDHIGDVLLARPALQALRLRYPRARITALVSSAGADLLALDPALDEILAWDAPWFNRQTNRETAARGFWAMVRCLRSREFDLSLDLRGDLRHHGLFLLAGVRVRAGYGITGGGFTLHVTRCLRPGIHEVERNLDLIRALGGKWPAPKALTRLALTRAEQRQGESFWQQARQRVVMHPGAGDPAKRWSVDHFAAVARALHQRHCEIVLVGSEAEKNLAQIVQGVSGCSLRIAAGQTSLRGLAAIITAADVFIGHDSGPAHMAMTQGVPTVFLWSATNEPEEWGPWGRIESSRVIYDPQRPDAVADVIGAASVWLKSSPGRVRSQSGKTKAGRR